MEDMEQKWLVRGIGLACFHIILFFLKKKKKLSKEPLFFFPDIPLRQVIAEECVAFLLNWRENEYLTMQVPLPLVQTNPYVKVMNTQSQNLVRLQLTFSR